MNTASKLAWGLRRHLWLIVLTVLGMAAAVPLAVERAPERYDAAAQVGPSQALKLGNLDALPKIGQSVFGNGAVANAVRAAGNVPDGARIVPDYVELVAAQDNVIFTIVGHGNSAHGAADLANTAAAAYARELNTYAASVGTFALQQPASPPRTPLPKLSTPLAITAGAAGGALIAIAAVTLWLAWRRPIVDVTTAELTTGSPVFGRLRMARGGRVTAGLPQLCRRLLVAEVNTALLVGARRSLRDRVALAEDLTRMAISVGADLRVVPDPTEADLAHGTASTLTVLVTREGVPFGELRRQAEQLLGAGPSGVVLVAHDGWLTAPVGTARPRRDGGTSVKATSRTPRSPVSSDELDG